MSEKRFKLDVRLDMPKLLIDNITNKRYHLLLVNDIEEIVDLLNTQQTTINKQLDQIIELQDKYRILEFNHSRLEKRNKAQYEKIGEQQDIINKLRKILAEAEDTIEVRLAEHYLKEYENIKQHIIGDNDE